MVGIDTGSTDVPTTSRTHGADARSGIWTCEPVGLGVTR